MNYEQQDLFKIKDTIKHELYFKGSDTFSYFTLWLSATTRIGEIFSCYFMKARMGTSSFWVNDVRHEYEDGEHRINIFLNGDIQNIYRSLLLEKALFFGQISFMEAMKDYGFQIDEKLRSIYKS